MPEALRDYSLLVLGPRLMDTCRSVMESTLAYRSEDQNLQTSPLLGCVAVDE